MRRSHLHLARPFGSEAGIYVRATTQESTIRLSPEVRLRAGRWLRDLREKRGLTQRGLAQKVGAECYTIVSQLEHGRGHVPSNLCLIWAQALGVALGEFARMLAPPCAIDPLTGDDPPIPRLLDIGEPVTLQFSIPATKAQ